LKFSVVIGVSSYNSQIISPLLVEIFTLLIYIIFL